MIGTELYSRGSPWSQAHSRGHCIELSSQIGDIRSEGDTPRIDRLELNEKGAVEAIIAGG